LVADAPQERETEPHGEVRSPPPPPDPAAEELWGHVLEHAEDVIAAPSLRAWFEAVTAVSLGTDYLTISVPNPFAKEYIESRFKATLEDALRQELSQAAALRVVVGAQGG
jgi:chromosomal replication initiator protein